MTITTRTAILVSDSTSGAEETLLSINGNLRRIHIINSTGTTQPTNSWDLTITGPNETLYTNTAVSRTGTTSASPFIACSSVSGLPSFYPIAGSVTVTGAHMGTGGKTATVLLLMED